MGIFFSNWYGVILILWGIAQAVAGFVFMYIIYHWTKNDQHRMIAVADAASQPEPTPLSARPAAVERREERRRAA